MLININWIQKTETLIKKKKLKFNVIKDEILK